MLKKPVAWAWDGDDKYLRTGRLHSDQYLGIAFAVQMHVPVIVRGTRVDLSRTSKTTTFLQFRWSNECLSSSSLNSLNALSESHVIYNFTVIPKFETQPIRRSHVWYIADESTRILYSYVLFIHQVSMFSHFPINPVSSVHRLSLGAQAARATTHAATAKHAESVKQLLISIALHLGFLLVNLSTSLFHAFQDIVKRTWTHA